MLGKKSRVQKALLEARKETNESKEFDNLKKVGKQNHSIQNAKRSREIPQSKCKYCDILHEPRRCPAYGKICTGCDRKITLRGCAEV